MTAGVVICDEPRVVASLVEGRAVLDTKIDPAAESVMARLTGEVPEYLWVVLGVLAASEESSFKAEWELGHLVSVAALSRSDRAERPTVLWLARDDGYVGVAETRSRNHQIKLPKTDRGVTLELALLARDTEPSVRHAVTRCPLTAEATLRALASDPDRDVAREAAMALELAPESMRVPAWAGRAFKEQPYSRLLSGRTGKIPTAPAEAERPQPKASPGVRSGGRLSTLLRSHS